MFNAKDICLYITCYVLNIYLLCHVLNETCFIIKFLIKILSISWENEKLSFQFYMHKTKFLLWITCEKSSEEISSEYEPGKIRSATS